MKNSQYTCLVFKHKRKKESPPNFGYAIYHKNGNQILASEGFINSSNARRSFRSLVALCKTNPDGCVKYFKNTKKKQYYFQFVGANNKIIATLGEGYWNLDDGLKTVKNLIAAAIEDKLYLPYGVSFIKK